MMEKIEDHEKHEAERKGSSSSEPSANDFALPAVTTSEDNKCQDDGILPPPPPPPALPPPSLLTGEEPPGEMTNAAAPAEDDPGNTPDYTIFTTWEKRGIVLGAAVGAILSPLTGQIYLPALPAVAADLGVSIAQVNLTLTTYMIFQGLAPMFIGSLADSAGRRPAYLVCFAIYIAANIGCALAPNYAGLLVLRMLQSAGSSATVALCQAVVADVVTSAERGSYVAFTALPSVLGPSLGPVLGGVIAQHLGWRWIFWVLALVGGAIGIVHAVFLPETCRHLVGDGSVRPPRAYWTLWQVAKASPLLRRRKQQSSSSSASVATKGSQATMAAAEGERTRGKRKKINLFKSLELLFEIEMFVLLAYGGVVVAGVYAILTSMSTRFPTIYGLNETQVGLMYLPMTGGTIAATIVVGKLQNWNFRRHCRLLAIPYDRRKQHDLTAFPIERARLEISMPLLALSAAATAAWGWALEYGAPLAVPAVLLVLLGFSLVGFSNTVWVLITDINPGDAGTAAAANNIIRCLLSAAATAAIDPLAAAAGLGWAFVLFAALFAAFSPCVALVMRNGVRWRRERDERRQRRRMKEEAEEATGAGGSV